MSIKFNPFTGTFDFVGSSTTTSSSDYNVIEDVDCDASVAIGDAVYMNGIGVAVRSQANSFSNGNFIGIAYQKPTSTTCHVLLSGLSPAIYGGLLENSIYYIDDSTAGGITSTAPTAPGSTIIVAGQAFSSTRLIVNKQIVVIRE
jgi:hypothetical protein